MPSKNMHCGHGDYVDLNYVDSQFKRSLEKEGFLLLTICSNSLSISKDKSIVSPHLHLKNNRVIYTASSIHLLLHNLLLLKTQSP